MKLITQIKIIFMTIFSVHKELAQKKLRTLIPLFWGLMLFSVLMVFINSVSPLAPFVYSLF